MRIANTVCFKCNKPCYIRPHQMARQKTWYCSKQCHLAAVKDRISEVCPMCDKPFRAKSSEQKVCSRSCANRSRAGIKYLGTQPNSRVTWYTTTRKQLVKRDGENCLFCEQSPFWQGKKLLLQIDHIDGNRKNNSLENLRLLCPNCHSQTETYSKPKKAYSIK